MTEVQITMRDASYPIEKTDFVYKNIDNYHQISYTLPSNTKAADDTSGNYSFPYSVGFTRDPVDEITRADQRYPGRDIDFVNKDIDH